MTLDELAVTVLDETAGSTRFGTHSFIELGGDSLLAMRLAALARERLGIAVPLRALLGGVPLATAFAEAEPIAVEPEAAEPAAPVPAGLSHVQRGMWLIESVTGGSPYNLVFTAFLENGVADSDTLHTAVGRTVARHEGLRTVFVQGDDGPVREVLADHVPEIDSRAVAGDVAEFETRVRAAVAESGRVPFDLAAAPAVRFLHFTHGSGRQALTLVAHHMVLDGTAVGLVFTELFAYYDELTGGEPVEVTPGVPLAALIRHQERLRGDGTGDRLADFWTAHLKGVPSVLELPADRQRPQVHDAAGARVPLDIGPACSAAVGSRARALVITPFALLLGAFGLTLARLTGVRRLLVGVPVVGRDTSELAELVGVAGNLVPVLIEVDDTVSVADYLRSVHRSLVRSIEGGQLPFEVLVAKLGIERSIGCHPLVQVCFGMHDQLVPQYLRTRSLGVRVVEDHGGGSQFDLTLLVNQARPTLAGHLEYATAVWGRAEVDGFIADFRAATEELAGDPDTALADVRCLSAQRRAALAAVNDVRRDFPATSVDALFQDVVGRLPDTVAVRDGDVALTYTELAGAAARQARLLREAGVRPGDRVLIGVERSAAEVVAVLGTVLAGAAYVGVDLDLPPAMLGAIVAKSAPAALLAAVEHEKLRSIPRVPTWDASWQGEPLTDPPPADSTRPAYVAFTSGSTGEPKGVQVPHRAVIRLVHKAGYLRCGPDDVMLRLAPLAFDASTLELWGALLTGATLDVYPAGSLPAPTDLGAFLREHGVTVAWLTAGLFRLVEEFSPDAFAGLRQLLTGGDVVPHDHARRVLRRHPGLVLTNGYGPTENTTFTATHTVCHADEITGPLPIGTPVPGTSVYVLDDRCRLVPPGAVGELYAGGVGLADGYLGDDAETARRFGHFSPDVPERLYRTGDVVRLDTRGHLTFLGRADDQVKLRGYRIELNAISGALKELPKVQDAVVVVAGSNSAAKRLVAAVVPAGGGTVSTATLRDRLATRLPAYMVPTLWVVTDVIPLTPNGKVDRDALAAKARPTDGVTEAEPDGEDADLNLIISLFAKARQGEDGGQPDEEGSPDTDFFTGGGTSFGAVRLIRMCKDELSVTLRLRDFLLAPTPAGVLHLIRKSQSR